MELMQRKDVPEELTWDLTAIYGDEAKLTADMENIRLLTDEIEKTCKGSLETAEAILACLDKFQELEQICPRPWTTAMPPFRSGTKPFPAWMPR